MFQNRQDAARKLFKKLSEFELEQPVVMGIPRGGIVVAAELARLLHADCDVVLSRKLRHLTQPELAMGAVAEDGSVYLTEACEGVGDDEIQDEINYQLFSIRERRERVLEVIAPIDIAGRSVIVTDDGVATGATMIAGLMMLRKHDPAELIVAVPVAPPETLAHLRDYADKVVCLTTPQIFWAIGQFYNDFSQVSEGEMLELLRRHKRGPSISARMQPFPFADEDLEREKPLF